MASPAPKRRRLNMIGEFEAARRSPRLQDKVAQSPRRSGRLSPKKLFPSEATSRKRSIASMASYNSSLSNLQSDGPVAKSKNTTGQKSGKGKKGKNKLWSSGPRLGGRGIPVAKMSKARRAQEKQHSRAEKVQAQKAQKTSPPNKSVLQEVSLGKLKLSNNVSPGVESSGPKKFFKTRDRRPETIVMKAGFDIKYKCNASGNEKIIKKETVVRKKRPLAVVVGKKSVASVSRNARPNLPKGGRKENSKENTRSIVAEVHNNFNDSNGDLLDATDMNDFNASTFTFPRTPRTPGTREEEMLASWGFDSFEMSSEIKVQSRKVQVKQVAKISVMSPQDLMLTPLLDEDSRSSAADKESDKESVTDSENGGKKKLFPVFTTSAKWANEKISGTPTSSPGNNSKRRKLGMKEGNEQYMLDAGQKLAGLIQCSTCGMSYNGDVSSDQEVHESFHNNILKTLNFQGWKTENVVSEYNDGSRIIMVNADNKRQMQKVEKIRYIVDTELGYVSSKRPIQPNHKIFLYISAKKEVAGYCLAEPIDKAYQLLPDSPSKKSAMRCGDVAFSVKCGINRIWVFHSYRHQGIATKLLESVRYHFLVGCPLTLEDLAYTGPTPDGRALFTKYNKHSEFKIYNI